jgi:hypothetical protein
MPPDVTMRISGITTPTVSLPTDPPGARTATVPALPRPLVYSVLALSTLLVIAGLALSVVGIGESLPKASPESLVPPWSLPRRVITESLTSSEFTIPTNSLSPRARALLELISAKPTAAMTENSTLQTDIASSARPDLLTALGYSDASAAASDIRQQIRNVIPRAVSARVWSILPSGPDDWARDRVSAMTIGDRPVDEFLQDVRAVVNEAVTRRPYRSRLPHVSLRTSKAWALLF